MNTVYSNAHLPSDIGTISDMRRWRFHATGFWIGFAFGTIGLFAIALLRLLLPFIEIVTEPLLWPSRFLAGFFAGDAASTWMVLFLYCLTGAFYGLIGSVMQEIHRRAHMSQTQGSPEFR